MAKQTPTKAQLQNLLSMPNDITNIIYSYVGNPFIITVNVKNRVRIPRLTSFKGLLIDWGDDTTESIQYFDENISHYYSCPGQYIVQIFGDITIISFQSVLQLVNISQWGNLRLTHCFNTFHSCHNLNITAIDTPDLRHVTVLYHMFEDCKSLNADFSKWDVSNITEMRYMFKGCIRLNSDFSNWNVSKVTNMAGMFYGCSSFNSDLSSWGVSNVDSMANMFKYCVSFNCDLSRWNVKNVVTMSGMFYGCVLFNSDLSSWDVSKLEYMSHMFKNCRLFKGNISNWNISNVKFMAGIFNGCNSFECDLTNWCNRKDIDMVSLFMSCNEETNYYY